MTARSPPAIGARQELQSLGPEHGPQRPALSLLTSPFPCRSLASLSPARRAHSTQGTPEVGARGWTPGGLSSALLATYTHSNTESPWAQSGPGSPATAPQVPAGGRRELRVAPALDLPPRTWAPPSPCRADAELVGEGGDPEQGGGIGGPFPPDNAGPAAGGASCTVNE